VHASAELKPDAAARSHRIFPIEHDEGRMIQMRGDEEGGATGARVAPRH
jgi:hypothetical protein